MKPSSAVPGATREGRGIRGRDERPALNRWFNRRWAELPGEVAHHQPTEPPPVADDAALTGLALLQDWRRQRDELAAVPR